MGRSGAAFILVLAGALPALAAELPSRKAGLWELKMSFENRDAGAIRQCINAATDHAMQSSAGPIAQATCPNPNVQRTATGFTIDSTCTVGGKTLTTHAVATGSFDSSYTMTVTSQGELALAGSATRTISAQWLGPCAADQKPGDMIMANGVKVNVLDMQRRAAQPGAPGVPAPPR